MKMKTNKDYPATHSMSTAWFCADLDGNVAIIDIDDDGPVPVGTNEGSYVYEIWSESLPTHTEERIYDLPLTDEQIAPLLLPKDDEEDIWAKDYGTYANRYWDNVIVKIDMSKLDVLRKALSHKDKDGHYISSEAICLSRKHGLFHLDLDYDREAVKILQDAGAILEVYNAPSIWPVYKDEDEPPYNMKDYPFFLYHQDYTPGFLPAERITSPRFPLKVEQLSKEQQAKIKTLPLKFCESKFILLAEHVPVWGAYTTQYRYDGKIWDMLAKNDKEVVYYNTSTHSIIEEETMKSLIENGEAKMLDSWDWQEDPTKNKEI